MKRAILTSGPRPMRIGRHLLDMGVSVKTMLDFEPRQDSLPKFRTAYFLALCLVLYVGRIGAATITVDGTECTLASALQAANTDAPVGLCSKGDSADTLQLTARAYAVTGIIDASNGGTGLPLIKSVITLTGGRKGAIIERAPGAPTFRLLRIARGGELTLNRISVRNGAIASPFDRGGGVLNEGKLTLNASSVRGNTAWDGGGIYSSGELTLTDSIVLDNLASDDGGGVFVGGQSAVITSSDLSRNRAANAGGGIMITGSRIEVEITNSVMAGNRAAFGGALYGYLYSNPNGLTVAGTLISGNSATDAGGGFYWYDGDFDLINSTLSGNLAVGDYAYGGGGYFYNGQATVAHTTFAMNGASGHAGGLRVRNAGLSLVNSLIADSVSGEDCAAYSADLITYRGRNLIEDGSCEVLRDGGLAQDPKLSLLLDYGGPTATHALAGSSPAKSIALAPDCRTTDQRGVSRPQGESCDIGAFETVETPNPAVMPVLDVIASLVRARQLEGTGRVRSVRKSRLGAIRQQLLAAGSLIGNGIAVNDSACLQLRRTLRVVNTGGSPDRNDYVTGSSAGDLARAIAQVRSELGCS